MATHKPLLYEGTYDQNNKVEYSIDHTVDVDLSKKHLKDNLIPPQLIFLDRGCRTV